MVEVVEVQHQCSVGALLGQRADAPAAAVAAVVAAVWVVVGRTALPRQS